jgi:acetyl-CoA carboxylase carboxyltransferase component
VLGTRVDPTSDAFARNRDRNLELVEQIQDMLAESRAGGGPEKVARHRDRDKLLLRERIQLLLDPAPRGWNCSH